MEEADFRRKFAALTGHVHFPWQYKLYSLLTRGFVPETCDIPTGLGKTSIIPTWAIALANSGGRPGKSAGVARRLVYIVNRRTVVDQATNVAVEMRRRLFNPDGVEWSEHKEALSELRASLGKLTSNNGDGGDQFLAVSTLRGEFADNEEWKADPARPAIIVGTIDMIGSKLLFSGYGDGRYHRAHHAGLIGQDVLIVHDEAHLTPAFSDLLRGIADEQRKGGELRPIQVMELSATQRRVIEDRGLLQLGPEDEENATVVQRLDAAKYLRVHAVEKTDVLTKLVDLAAQNDAAASKVLIYVRSPNEAQQVFTSLKSRGADGRIALLTGTIRGHERDKLIANPPTTEAGRIVRLFLGGTRPEQTVYLVSTSAGEVGIDLDADHLVCDLTTLDSMIQRLGRVNRRGGQGRAACVEVVASVNETKDGERPSEVESAVQQTYSVIQRWQEEFRGKVSVSPRNLRTLVAQLPEEERTRAFSPKPAALPLTDILLDAWSLTSIAKMPGRPEIAAYLHGVTHDPPETHVAWRKEVALLQHAGVEEETLGNWFRACRITPRERLRDDTSRVHSTLKELLRAHKKETPERDFPVVLLDERGDAKWSSLSEIVGDKDRLRYQTVVLPVEAGGLDATGMLNAKSVEPVADIDVAEAPDSVPRRERWLYTQDEQYQRLISGETAESLPPRLREQERITLNEPAEGAEGDEKTSYLLLLMPTGEAAMENPETVRFGQPLEQHTDAIVECIGRIADRLGLEPLKDTLVRSARWHDRGKDRAVWQRYACNSNGTAPRAKSKTYLHARTLWGYRHEFGSLLEASQSIELREHPERDLILHLIGTHHGHGRPHFEHKAFDHERFSTGINEAAAAEVMRRFGRLQQRFGRWGLAWLESLLRCADIAASQLAAEANDPASGVEGKA